MIGNPSIGSQDTTSPTFGLTFIGNLVPALVSLSLVAGTVFFFWTLVTGAMAWMSAKEDKQAIESARSKVLNSVVGITILFSVYALLNFIDDFFGLTILTLDLQPLVN